jgi:hypothetical protein
LRQFSAILLLTLIALSLLTPAFGANEDAGVPACCRRLGAHRCSMGSPVSRQTSAAAPALRNSRKCPLYTNFTSLPAHAVFGATEPARATFLSVTITDLLGKQAEVARVVSLTRAHSKRGPPAA